MVIHPPTLFLGFACTLVPFSYCIAGLWQKKYRDWVNDKEYEDELERIRTSVNRGVPFGGDDWKEKLLERLKN